MMCVITFKKPQWDIISHNDIGKSKKKKNLKIPSIGKKKYLPAAGGGVNGQTGE